MDELPFLDTDLGRATVVLTADDFAFFVVEHDLDHSLVTGAPADTRFFAVQFIELGGDHLDQLMNPDLCASQAARDIVARTQQLLGRCHKIVYFANGQQLFSGPNQALAAQPLEILLRRLAFLAASCEGVNFMITMVRCQASFMTLDEARDLWRLLPLLQGLPMPSFFSASVAADAAKVVTPVMLLQAVLQSLQTRPEHAFLARGVDVQALEHLHTDGSLWPEAIIATLARMFRNSMIQSSVDPSFLVAHHLFACFRQPILRMVSDDVFDLWVDRETFRAYLDEAHNLEVPETLMLQKFDSVAQILIAKGLCLRHHSLNLTGTSLTVSLAGQDVGTLQAHTKTVDGMQIRFPYFSPLLDVLEYYFAQDIPGELWLQEAEPFLQPGLDQALRDRLEQACFQLEHAVQEATVKLEFVGDDLLPLYRWIWLVEELGQARQLLGQSPCLQLTMGSLALFHSVWRHLADLYGPVVKETDVLKTLPICLNFIVQE